MAEVFLARAADAGDTLAADLLKAARGDVPDTDDLETYFEDTADTRTFPLDATHYGVALEKQGRLDEARAYYEKGHDRGDAYGAYRLAVLLNKQGNPDEAQTWYRKAADLGHPGAKKALAENPDTVGE